MCSRDNGNEGLIMMPSTPFLSQRNDNEGIKRCSRCQVEIAIIFEIDCGASCSSCFIKYMTNKFRKDAIGAVFPPLSLNDVNNRRNWRSPHRPRCALAVSGSESSLAMLALTVDSEIFVPRRCGPNDAYTEEQPPVVLFIDDSSTYDDEHAVKDRGNRVSAAAIEAGWEFKRCSIGDVYLPSLSTSNSFEGTLVISKSKSSGSDENYNLIARNEAKGNFDCDDGDGEANVKATFAALDTKTARDDLRRYLRQRLLLHMAKSNNCSVLLVADTATQVAIRALTDVCTGRGNGMASNVGAFVNNADSLVSLGRPMRGITSREAALFLHYTNRNLIEQCEKDTNECKEDSIGLLVTRFLAQVQDANPATIHAVARTAAKITNSREGSKVNNDTTELTKIRDVCPICCAPFSAAATSTTACARKFVVKEDVTRNNGCSSGIGCCSDECGNNDSKISSEAFDQVDEIFCYGCRVLLRDIRSRSSDSLFSLPPYVAEATDVRRRRGCMRASIADFLIDDEDI